MIIDMHTHLFGKGWVPKLYPEFLAKWKALQHGREIPLRTHFRWRLEIHASLAGIRNERGSEKAREHGLGPRLLQRPLPCEVIGPDSPLLAKFKRLGHRIHHIYAGLIIVTLYMQGCSTLFQKDKDLKKYQMQEEQYTPYKLKNTIDGYRESSTLSEEPVCQ